jgi:NADPH-dependent curcumin reductase CurA
VGINPREFIELAVHLLLCVHLHRCRDESVKEVLKKEYPQGLDIIYEVGDN